MLFPFDSHETATTIYHYRIKLLSELYGLGLGKNLSHKSKVAAQGDIARAGIRGARTLLLVKRGPTQVATLLLLPADGAHRKGIEPV